MDSIGVREARQNLSVYLDRVKAGESLTITEHGKPVAVLNPVNAGPSTEEDAYQAMVDAGEITPAKRRFLPRELPRLEPGERLLSEVLREMRDEERY